MPAPAPAAPAAKRARGAGGAGGRGPLPPFFTQGIGSLPRPAEVRAILARRSTMDCPSHESHMKQQRQQKEEEKEATGGGGSDQQAALDAAVLSAIRMQEDAGLDVVSDGEWRRAHYMRELLDRLGGFEKKWPFQHHGVRKVTAVVTRRMVDPVGSLWADDARFLVAHARRRTKFAVPSPFLIAVRCWHPELSRAAYATRREFLDHLTRIVAREAAAIAAAGVDIIQIDDPALTYFCDASISPEHHDERLRIPELTDPDTWIPAAVASVNTIADALPRRGEVEVQLHCCHSVCKRRSDVKGSYAPLLPRLAALRVERVNLEFAYQGTGEVADLALLPAHLKVGVGVVDVRGERVQSAAEIEAIAAAAAKVIAPDRIALNPDCGFAPDYCEPPTVDEAVAKLTNMVRAARALQGKLAATQSPSPQ